MVYTLRPLLPFCARFSRFEDALALREVKSLRAIPKHPNIVRLRQLIHESEYVHFVFELCTSNLFKVRARLPAVCGLPQCRLARVGVSAADRHWQRALAPTRVTARRWRRKAA